MFDLSWSHIGLFVVIALLVLGPKELPNAIRTGAQLLRAGRKLAGEFRSGMDELMKEAELEETRRSIKAAVTEGIDKMDEHVDSTGELKAALENPAIGTTAGETTAGENTAGEAKPAELAGPPNPGASEPAATNIVINDPPPAPPNSVVPPPPEGTQPSASTPATPAASEQPAIATEAEDLKKTA